MDEENKWEKVNKLFEFLITEDNETGKLVCSSCNEDITDNKGYHNCSPLEIEYIYF
jgi:hypothetical protein